MAEQTINGTTSGAKLIWDEKQIDGVASNARADGKADINMSVSFTDSKPISFDVQNIASNLVTYLNPNIQNKTSDNWIGFKIDVVDAKTGISADFHPVYTHMHDASVPSSGWVNPVTGSFSTYQGVDAVGLTPHAHAGVTGSLQGASELNLSGGNFAANTSEAWSAIGIHDFGGTVGTDTFKVTLTPIVEAKVTPPDPTPTPTPTPNPTPNNPDPAPKDDHGSKNDHGSTKDGHGRDHSQNDSTDGHGRDHNDHFIFKPAKSNGADKASSPWDHAKAPAPSQQDDHHQDGGNHGDMTVHADPADSHVTKMAAVNHDMWAH
jgi:hypothetical protein